MAKNGNGISAEQMITAINEAQGYVTRAADLLGVSRQTFYVYLKKYKTAKDALDNSRERRHEWVESKLMKAIKDDNLTAIIFYLKTQGKHLGYVERQELTGADSGPITFNVVYKDGS